MTDREVKSGYAFGNKGISTVSKAVASTLPYTHSLSRTNLHFSTLTRHRRLVHTGGGAERIRFVFIYFPLKHEKGGIPQRERSALISTAQRL